MDLVKRSCNVCVTTALRLIDNIHRNLGNSYTCSAWHSVYCKIPPRFNFTSDAVGTNGSVTFASALILLSAPMCPAIHVESTRSSLDMSWSQCLSILEHYRDQIQAARRAIVALQELKSRMSHSRSQGMKNLFIFSVSPFPRRLVLITWTLLQTSTPPRVCHCQPRRSHTIRRAWT